LDYVSLNLLLIGTFLAFFWIEWNIHRRDSRLSGFFFKGTSLPAAPAALR
jgi:hypothetical protein